MKLPKELTTVTSLSKYMAMVVFIALPIVGFLLGMRYQEILTLNQQANDDFMSKSPTQTQIIFCPEDIKTCPDGTRVTRQPPTCEFAACPTVDSETANWKTYRNEEFEFEVKYPPNFLVDEGTIESFIAHFYSDYQNNNPTGPYEVTIDELILKEETIEESLSKRDAIFASKGDIILKKSDIAIDGRYATQRERFKKSDRSCQYSIETFIKITSKMSLLVDTYICDGSENLSDSARLFNNQILSTFKFIDNTAEKCATYTLNDQKTYACATCGNGVCEKYETCTATNFKDGVPPLPECGRLYCGKDCY